MYQPTSGNYPQNFFIAGSPLSYTIDSVGRFGYVSAGPSDGNTTATVTVPADTGVGLINSELSSSGIFNWIGFGMKEIPDTCDNTTARPVYYATGGARMVFDDFLGNRPAAIVQSMQRTWSNVSRTADSQSVSFGSGASFEGLSYITSFTNPQKWIDRDSFVVVSDGKAHAVFQNLDGTYFSTGEGELSKYKYAVNAATNHVIETKPDGTVTEFYRNGSGATSGKMISRQSPTGDTMTTTWDASGTRPTSMTLSYSVQSGSTSTTMNESFAFDYAGSTNRVTRVTQSQNGTAVRTVDYGYYSTGSANGNDGDLKSVTKRNGGPTAAIAEESYYRWYTSDTSTGYVGGLKYYVGDTAAQKVVHDNGGVSLDSISDSTLLDYADNYFEYDTNGNDHRVTKEVATGDGAGCSCGKTGAGVYTLSYTTNPNPTTVGGRNAWLTKTLETLPDGNQNIVYTNAAGQIILNVSKETSTGNQYYTWSQYDGSGNVIRSAEGNAVTGKSEGFADLVGYGQSGTLLAATGRINVTNYFNAGDGVAIDLYRYAKSTGYQIGSTGAFVPTDSWSYTDGGVSGDGVYYTLTRTSYPDASNLSTQQITTYDYEGWWQVGGVNTSQAKIIATHLAKVSAAQNGADSTTGGSSSTYVTREYLDSAGRTVWSADGEGYLTYYAYDPETGAVVKRVEDVNPSTITTAAVAAPTRASGLPAAANLVTTYEVDDQGRVTKQVDPNGVVTYTVYDDSATDGDPRSVTTYAGWDAALNQPTGPVRATIIDPATGIRDEVTYTYSAAGGLPVDGNGRPTGAESLSSVSVAIRSLTRSISNVSGQVIQMRRYTSFTGLTYDPTSSGWATLGTPGSHYLLTKYKYDSAARLFETTAPDGTISTTVFDVRGLAISTWKGTNNTGATEADPTGGATAGNNMAKVTASVYDATGNLIESRAYFGSSTSNYYASFYQYDARNRLIGSVGPDGIGENYTLDNLGRQIKVERFADTTVNTNGTLNYGAASNLRGKVEYAYDDQSRVYRTTTYKVDLTSGVASTSLAQNTWYDRRGNAIKKASSNGLFQKTQYDGVGRVVSAYVSYDNAEIAWADADDVVGDTVVSQQDVIYVGDRQAIGSTLDRTTATGSTTGRLTKANARLNATVMWYDVAGRVVASGSYGTDPDNRVFGSGGAAIDANSDGVPDIYGGPVPTANTASGQLFLVLTKSDYDDAGRVGSTTDNAGRVTKYKYDLLGRQTAMIENAIGDGVVLPTTISDTNRTTEWHYDPWGRLVFLRALNPLGAGSPVELQDTQYFYGSDIDRSWVTATIYPDSGNDRDLDANGNFDPNQDVPVDFDWDLTGKGVIDTNAASATDYVADEYDRLGRKTKTTDQRGVVHEYVYDSAGRLSVDKVTSLGRSGENVDGTIRAIVYGYDDLSRQQTVTSYKNISLSSGSVANQVKLTYDGWGNVVKSEQNSYGFASTGTPAVNYVYEDGAVGGVAKYVRLSQVEYPNGRDLYYTYGGDAANNKLNRVYEVGDSLVDTDATFDARYFYSGTGTIIRETRSSGTSKLDYDPSNNGTLSGFDRFGRILGQTWSQNTTPTSTPTWAATDTTSYAYDANSNRTTKITTGEQSPRHDYTYDGLDRLVGETRSSSYGGEWYSSEDGQAWGLDALGNWRTSGADSNNDGAADSPETRTHNAANEITGVSGAGNTWGTPTYDSAGNQTRLPGESHANIPSQGQPNAYDPVAYQTAKYDAWNRLVFATQYSASAQQMASEEFRYDGLGRKIGMRTSDSPPAEAGYDAYYDESWREIERRDWATLAPREQNVWSQRYIDALISNDKLGSGPTTPATTAGTLDTSFDTDGKVTLNIDGTDYGRRVAVQSDGKILVVGRTGSTTSTYDFAVVRYNTNGSLDTSWGTTGIVRTSLGSSDEAFSLAITSTGKVLVVGNVDGQIAVARYNTDGTLDTSFGTSGKKVISGTTWYTRNIILQSDGKMILVGQKNPNGSTAEGFVLRLNADGSTDSTWNSGSGAVLLGALNITSLFGVVLDSSGKVVVAGNGKVGTDSINFGAARINANGTLDTTFGTGGGVVVQFGAGGDTAYDLAIQSDGKIVLAGYGNASSSPYQSVFGMTRLTTAGAIDTAFGSSGKVQGNASAFASGESGQANAITIQSDGKIVLAGSSGGDFALARYTASGVLDTTFGTAGTGRVKTDFAGASDGINAIVKDAQGRFVVAGAAGADLAVARFHAVTGAAISGNRRLWAQQDANFNVTSIADDSGALLEQYSYTAYGQRTILFQSSNQSAYKFWFGHQGGRIDAATGLINFRNREYTPSLGRWTRRDPAGYVDGASIVNSYGNNPIRFTDEMGLDYDYGTAPNGVAPGIDWESNSAGAWTIGWEYVLNDDEQTRFFGPNDDFTKQMQGTKTADKALEDARKRACQLCKGGPWSNSGNYNYSPGIGRYLFDYLALGVMWNTNSFVGGYVGSWTITSLNCDAGKATVKFTGRNESGLKSMTRIPGTSISLSDNKKGGRNFRTQTQVWTYEEEISFEKCCK